MFNGTTTWKCLDCGESRVRSSITSLAAHMTCPTCGSKRLKATHANPSPVRIQFTRDQILNLGMDLLLEAQR